MVVYQHIRLDTNEIFYIGIGKTKKRCFSKFNRNKYWNNIVNKTAYKVEIIHNNLCCWELACYIETHLIQFYGRKDLGKGVLVNMTDGGEGVLNSHHNLGKRHSEETKLKMRIKANNRPSPTGEHLEKFKFSQLGCIPKNRKKILKLDKSNNILDEYDFILDASIKNNIIITAIINNLKGRSKSAGGYIWKYIN
jgi:hypothetical protein